MIKEATLVFSPNQVLSKSMVKILVVSQIIVLGAIWFLHPFVFFPTPIEVWRSFGHMWSLGLGAELMTSFQLSLEAIGVATIISLVLAYLTVVPFFRPIVTFISKLRFLSLVGNILLHVDDEWRTSVEIVHSCLLHLRLLCHQHGRCSCQRAEG
jgi:NitT/TauT family transport system permease protein